jgi:hypothetical protein
MSTFTGSVSASARDAQQQAVGNAATINDGALQSAARAYWGIAFTSVTIPQGSFIGGAWISIYGVTKYPSVNTTIYGEAANNAAAYAATSNNLSNRTRTTANVAWTKTVAADGFQQTPDVRAVVQEIVSRASFASGNALSTIWLNNTSSPGFSAYTFDASNGNQATISIDYYSGQGGLPSAVSVTTTVGTPTATSSYTASVSAVAVTATVGAPTVSSSLTVSVTSITVGVTTGVPSWSSELTRSTSSVIVGATIGTATAVNLEQTVTTTSVAAAVVVGPVVATSTISATVAAVTAAFQVGRAHIYYLVSPGNVNWTARDIARRTRALDPETRYTAEQVAARWTAGKVKK